MVIDELAPLHLTFQSNKQPKSKIPITKRVDSRVVYSFNIFHFLPIFRSNRGRGTRALIPARDGRQRVNLFDIYSRD